MKEVYLDHAATTYLDPRVKAAMEPYWEEEFGNPSSLYRRGRNAKDALDNARSSIAKVFSCRPDELIFTGGGTEAINLAIFGVAHSYSHVLKNMRVTGERVWLTENNRQSGVTPEHSNILQNVGMLQGQRGHIVTTKIEHHAVLHAVEALEKEGFEATYLDVDEYGRVSLEDIRNAIRPDTILVSVMYANNEIGTIEPVAKIGKIIREAREERKREGNQTPIFFHTDACQAAGALDINVQNLEVDLLAINGSKIYGPKGVGCLFVRRGIRLKPLIYGGGQEQNLRSGTENVPGVIGLAHALEIADTERAQENVRLAGLRDYFVQRLTKEISKVVLNGHPTERLPNNVNVSVLDIEGEAVILYLDAQGIAISTGSACTSTTLDPSHVILAIGRPYEYAHSSLRFTLGRKTTKEDLDYVMEVFPGIVEKLRVISPIRMEVGQKEISHPEAFAGQHSKVKVGGRTYK